jgi:hypothetical protein
MLNRIRRNSHTQQRRRIHLRLKNKVNNRRHTHFIHESMFAEHQQEK